jgi:hypothetical protein
VAARLARRGWIFTRTLAVAMAAPLLLRFRPERLAKVLEPRIDRVDTDAERIAETLRIADVVLARGRPLVRNGCLTRGVTRYWALRRAGADVSLCFGVGTIDGAVEAHCWIDREGTTVLEPRETNSFHEMFRLCRPGVMVAAT